MRVCTRHVLLIYVVLRMCVRMHIMTCTCACMHVHIRIRGNSHLICQERHTRADRQADRQTDTDRHTHLKVVDILRLVDHADAEREADV